MWKSSSTTVGAKFYHMGTRNICGLFANTEGIQQFQHPTLLWSVANISLATCPKEHSRMHWEQHSQGFYLERCVLDVILGEQYTAHCRLGERTVPLEVCSVFLYHELKRIQQRPGKGMIKYLSLF